MSPAWRETCRVLRALPHLFLRANHWSGPSFTVNELAQGTQLGSVGLSGSLGGLPPEPLR